MDGDITAAIAVENGELRINGHSVYVDCMDTTSTSHECRQLRRRIVGSTCCWTAPEVRMHARHPSPPTPPAPPPPPPLVYEVNDCSDRCDGANQLTSSDGVVYGISCNPHPTERLHCNGQGCMYSNEQMQTEWCLYTNVAPEPPSPPMSPPPPSIPPQPQAPPPVSPPPLPPPIAFEGPDCINGPGQTFVLRDGRN